MTLSTIRPTILAAAAGLLVTVACAPAAAPPAATPKPAAATTASPSPSPSPSPVASPVATAAAAIASPAATVAAASPVRITAAQVTPSDTTITVQNAGNAAVDMSGWRLRVGTSTAALPGNAQAAPGEAVTIHTASGTSTARDIYLGQEAASLVSGLQPGATVALVNAQNQTVTEFVLPR